VVCLIVIGTEGFVYLADALQTGDLYVVGAENFADYRAQLLPWAECEARLPAYCTTLGIAERGEDFAAALKAELTTLAAAVDAGFAANSELSIDADGTPHLKQLATTEQPAGLTEFEHEIRARMPERHLLDILKHAEHWSRYTRHFGPPSGSDPKLARAVQRYLFTVFGYGCNLGPARPPGTRPRWHRRKRCAGSTRSTSTPASLRRRWLTSLTSMLVSLCPVIGAAAAPPSPTARM
jgi:Tn3 transposase DDE domain